MDNLIIVTVNVRGMRNFVKRGAVFDYLSTLSFHVCLLQEVHLKDREDVKLFSEEWKGGQSRWGVGGVHSSGVGILFKGWDFDVEQVFSFVQGRVLGVDFKWRGLSGRVVNVYAPTDSAGRRDLFGEIGNCLITNRVLILGGDFNVSLEGRGDFSLGHLEKVIRQFNLIDSFRKVNPGVAGTTWSNSRGVTSRIDFIFVEGATKVASSEINPVWFSDHHSLQTILEVQGTRFGKGFWKCNVSVLKEREFFERFSEAFEGWVDLKVLFDSKREWWDWMKVRIKGFIINFCRQRSRREKGEFFKLQRQLESFFVAGNLKGEASWEGYNELQGKLRGIFEERARRVCFAAKRDFLEKNETCSAYFFNLVKQTRVRKGIQGLRGADGVLRTEIGGMVEVATNFYQGLFRRREVDFGEGERFLGGLEKELPKEVREELEGEISLAELSEALRGLQPNKVPGADGLPVELYRAFWDKLGPELLEVCREIYREGVLTNSMREGIISLLFKKGDTDQIKNWRPVTLLCVDLKLVAKVLTGRLKRALPSVIGEDQTCGIVGRQMVWNLHLVRDAISWARDRGLPLMLVGLDQEKAFDRVSHEFLFRVLGRLGFGPNFLKWVGILYKGVGSRVNLNGYLSALILQEGGVRQGCPLSPLLYVAYMEPFAAAIRRAQGIRGIRMPGAGGRVVKISQYADDTTLLLEDEVSLGRALGVIDSFAKASGSKLNRDKSLIKFFGGWEGRTGGLCGLAGCPGPLRVLGIDFGNGEQVEENWAGRIRKIRGKLGLWQTRSLSVAGKILVVKAEVLPSLLFLARVFPLPPKWRRTLQGIIFKFIWGGYEYVGRELDVSGGREGR